jgi:hypothetical protein
VGSLSLSPPGQAAPLLPGGVASHVGTSSSGGPACHPTSWSQGSFAISASSLQDGFLLCPRQEYLFYCEGYFHLHNRLLDATSPKQFLLPIITKLLAALNAGAPAVLRDLSGSFLLLVYDSRHNTLWVVPDRLASRPLFYYSRAGIFRFANNLPALLRHPALDRSLDLCALVEFLRFSMILGDRTLYQQVKTVPPATILKIGPGGLHFQPYWSLDYDESCDRSHQDYIYSLGDVFKRATGQLVSHPDNSALMLSGGLDSRMIAASLCSSGVPLRAISFGGFENDDVKLARRVARHCGFPFIFLKRSPAYYPEILPGAVDLSHGLYAFHHAHLLGLHRQIRALGIDTLIHGWGLDLLFSGSYQPKRLVRHLPGRSFYLLWPRPFENQAAVIQSLYSALALGDDPLFSQLPTHLLSEIWRQWPQLAIARWVEQSAAHAGDFHNQFDWVILRNFSRFRSFLYPLSVRSGFKERCPLYDNRVLDQYLCLPPPLRFCSRAYGMALETLSQPLARIPYSRTGSSVRAPEFVQFISYFLKPAIQTIRLRFRRIARQHMAYPAEAFDSYPHMDVLFRRSALGRIAQERFASSVLGHLGLINSNVLREMLARHLRGDANYGDRLGTLLTLETWLSDWS